MRENSESSVACHHQVGFLGLLITLGIVFGDIGTSPLYVMKAILHTGEAINESTILGALSCIIWTLTLQTTIKYVCVALRADNNGEGGILALYALLRKMKRKWIYLLAIIGASTLLADGIITPAITVTTAIEGLESISPHLPVIPITLGIITIIFFVQRFGTESIGKSFGVFMLIWFLLLGVTGAFSITSYPLILKAFNPYYAAMLLAESPEWFLILGAVFLCTTGAEALYSDLGHCGRKNITISWLFVKAMLILNYLGQGAMGAEPYPDCLLRESVLFHHATEHADFCHHHGHGCGNRCQSGTYQRHLLHIERSHEPALLATHANQASYPCKGTALYPGNQPRHVHRRGAHHPALPRLLAHGGSLWSRHHHHHADDHPAARFLPAHQGCGASSSCSLWAHIALSRAFSLPPTCQNSSQEDGVRCLLAESCS